MPSCSLHDQLAEEFHLLTKFRWLPIWPDSHYRKYIGPLECILYFNFSLQTFWNFCSLMIFFKEWMVSQHSQIQILVWSFWTKNSPWSPLITRFPVTGALWQMVNLVAAMHSCVKMQWVNVMYCGWGHQVAGALAGGARWMCIDTVCDLVLDTRFWQDHSSRPCNSTAQSQVIHTVECSCLFCSLWQWRGYF